MFRAYFVLIALLLCLLSACHSVSQSNTSSPTTIQDPRTTREACLGGPSSIPQVENNAAYTFVRFRLDELGRRVHCDQISTVIETVTNPTGAGVGPLVVVFVHGWKHDGSTKDEYINSFRQFLAELETAEARHSPKWRRRVVGIYVSWPANNGASLGLLQNLWFWTIRDRADRIARGGEVNKLLSSLNAHLGYLKPHRDIRDGMLVTIGHSFGGRIVFESVQQTMADNVIREGRARDDEKCAGNVVCHTITGFGEVVVLLNPAFEAAQYNVFFRFSGGNWLNTVPDTDSLKLSNLESWPQMQPPLMLSLGATNDEATNRPWQIAQGLVDPTLGTTLTNFDPYITHDLTFNSSDVGKKITDSAGVLDRTRTLGPVNGISLVPRSIRNNSPFIVARVDPQIINGHGGIWTAALRDFLVEYLHQIEGAKQAQTNGIYYSTY